MRNFTPTNCIIWVKFSDIDMVQISDFQKNNHKEYYQIKIDDDFIQWGGVNTTETLISVVW